MAQKSTKSQQGADTVISVKFDGGLNYSESPSHIADNELCRALNVIYNSQTGTPETRPGTTCVTAAPLAHPIQKIYYYEKSVSLSWLVCASGGKLYYLDVDVWVEIGALNDSTTVPTFLTFNTFLLIADGGANIKKWDGSTLTALTDGLDATAIAEIGGRVVINSKADPDLVTFSGVEDETMWDTADLTNPAIGLRAGFGDNMIVNGFAVFSSDLIISKHGSAEKRMYRITTSGVPTDWTVSLLSSQNAAQNPQSIVAAFNNIFFADTNGFKSIQGVTAYGDLAIDATGAKINTQFAKSGCHEMMYLPYYSSVWILLDNRIYSYNQNSTSEGDRRTFTDMQFVQGSINSVAQVESDIYLAGLNGYLYKFDETSSRDETTPGVFEYYPTVMTSKQFNVPEGYILRRTTVELKAMETASPSTVYLKMANGTILKTISVLTSAQELNTATEELAVAFTLLGSMSGAAWLESTTNRVRGTTLQFQVDSTGGRFGVESLTANITLVGN